MMFWKMFLCEIIEFQLYKDVFTWSTCWVNPCLWRYSLLSMFGRQIRPRCLQLWESSARGEMTCLKIFSPLSSWSWASSIWFLEYSMYLYYDFIIQIKRATSTCQHWNIPSPPDAPLLRCEPQLNIPGHFLLFFLMKTLYLLFIPSQPQSNQTRNPQQPWGWDPQRHPFWR